MSTISIKDRLLGKIALIEDENFLQELEEIINNLNNESNEVFTLSGGMKTSIEKSEKDLEDGKLVPNSKAIRYFKAWLKSK